MTLTLMSAKNASLVIRGEHWRLALAAHRGGAIDENINAAELAEHWAAAAFETGIIAGISDPALHPLVLARFPQRQFERAPIACHQGEYPTGWSGLRRCWLVAATLLGTSTA
jgi:hypothetical protein